MLHLEINKHEQAIRARIAGQEPTYPKVNRKQGGGSQIKPIPEFPDDLIIICHQNFREVVPSTFSHRAWFIACGNFSFAEH